MMGREVVRQGDGEGGKGEQKAGRQSRREEGKERLEEM